MSYGAMSLHEFSDRFATQDSCLDVLIRRRWPNGWTCPHCSGTQCYRLRSRRALQCAKRSCRAQVSVTTGTIFEQIKIPLPKVFLAMYLMSTAQHVTAKTVASQLAVAYNTAFDLLRKLRTARTDHAQAAALDDVLQVADQPHAESQRTMPTQQPNAVAERNLVHLRAGTA